MEITIQDGSNYFKGLLILIRKDGKISSQEHALLLRVGTKLGFDKEFIEESISEILYNLHITKTPPAFTNRDLAEKFIKDGLIIAASDSEIHPEEENWLLKVARKNRIENEWFYIEKKLVLSSKRDPDNLEADKLKVLF